MTAGPTTPDAGEAAPASADAGRGVRSSGISIREFLTDGGLARLCDALGAALGLEVFTVDEGGHRVRASEADGLPTWSVDAEPVLALDGDERVPVPVAGRVVGELVVRSAAPGPPPAGAVEVLRLLALVAGELCEDVLDLRHRSEERSALFRLSSMLTNRGTTLESMLEAALDTALGVFGLTAGSVVLFPEDTEGVPVSNQEGDVVLKASRGLSREWLESPLPLSKGRAFDRLVLGGAVLAVEDLTADERVNEPERLSRERVRCFLSAAMIVSGRATGVIRLYGPAPRAFSEAERRLLRSIADHSAAVVQQARLLEVQKNERRMERQLKLASDVQARMLPARLPSLPGLDLAARSIPSYELGGDLFDAFEVRVPKGLPGARRGLGLVVGDVVGKGVAAALLMSSVRASLRAYEHMVGPLDELLALVNRAMCRDTLPNEFATLWYGTVEPLEDAHGGARALLRYSSAGHEPPFLIRARAGRAPTIDDVRPLGMGGLVLGVDPAQVYPLYEVELRSGDVLVAHTDGMTDARDFDERKFGWTRLVDSVLEPLAEDPGASAQHILDHAMWAVKRFAGIKRQTDDETLVVLRVT